MTRISSGAPSPPLRALARSIRRFKVSSAAVSASRSSGRDAPSVDAVRHLGQALENGELLGLPIRQHRQHALDVRDGGQALERGLLGLELRERRRRRERGEHRASRRGGGLPLPDDRLRAVGLEIQHVVVEAHPRRGPQRRSGHEDRGGDDGLRIPRTSHSSAGTSSVLRRFGGCSPARSGPGRPVSGASRGAFCQPSISSTPAGKTVSIAEERQKDRGAGDESEVADAAELGDGQDVEGHRRGEGSEQDAGAASRRGTLECADERRSRAPALPDTGTGNRCRSRSRGR